MENENIELQGIMANLKEDAKGFYQNKPWLNRHCY